MKKNLLKKKKKEFSFFRKHDKDNTPIPVAEDGGDEKGVAAADCGAVEKRKETNYGAEDCGAAADHEADMCDTEKCGAESAITKDMENLLAELDEMSRKYEQLKSRIIGLQSTKNMRPSDITPINDETGKRSAENSSIAANGNADNTDGNADGDAADKACKETIPEKDRITYSDELSDNEGRALKSYESDLTAENQNCCDKQAEVTAEEQSLCNKQAEVAAEEQCDNDQNKSQSIADLVKNDDCGQAAAEVAEFLSEFPLASKFAARIAEKADGFKPGPGFLEKAYISVLYELLDEQRAKNSEENIMQAAENNPKIRDKIIYDYLSSLRSGNPKAKIALAGKIALTPPQRPKNFEEAGLMAKNILTLK